MGIICHATDCSPPEVIISDLIMDEIIAYDNFLFIILRLPPHFYIGFFILELNKLYSLLSDFDSSWIVSVF